MLVGITVYRIQGVTIRHYSQQYRSLFASLEILAAAAVSNALVLGSFVRDRGTKKQRFRFGSTGGHSSLDRGANAPRRVITARTWGSDVDLAGDLGMRLDPELTEKDAPRPAPKASLSGLTPNAGCHDTVDQKWTFPERRSIETDDIDLKSPDFGQLPSPGEVPNSPRRMSFFDVGGLLENDHSTQMHSHHSSNSPPPPVLQKQPLASPFLHPSTASTAATGAEARRGSHAFLQDIGGLLSPSSTRATTPRATTPRPVPESQHSGLIEALQSTPPSTSTQPFRPPRPKREKSLEDVGGLLS